MQVSFGGDSYPPCPEPPCPSPLLDSNASPLVNDSCLSPQTTSLGHTQEEDVVYTIETHQLGGSCSGASCPTGVTDTQQRADMSLDTTRSSGVEEGVGARAITEYQQSQGQQYARSRAAHRGKIPRGRRGERRSWVVAEGVREDV